MGCCASAMADGMKRDGNIALLRAGSIACLDMIAFVTKYSVIGGEVGDESDDRCTL